MSWGKQKIKIDNRLPSRDIETRTASSKVEVLYNEFLASFFKYKDRNQLKIFKLELDSLHVRLDLEGDHPSTLEG
jgi:hypothetical protein